MPNTTTTPTSISTIADLMHKARFGLPINPMLVDDAVNELNGLMDMTDAVVFALACSQSIHPVDNLTEEQKTMISYAMKVAELAYGPEGRRRAVQTNA